MIRLLADEQLLLPADMLHNEIQVETYNPIQGWTTRQIETADALFVRTVSRVDESTIGNSTSVRFVATASAGKDHVNEEWLQSQGIAFADAAGSNAISVAEYISMAILSAFSNHESTFCDVSVGIAGVGHTGSATAAMLDNLGFKTVLYDPPKEERSRHGTPSLTANDEIDFKSASLDAFLSTDILTFHVPLTDHGDHPTRYLLTSDHLQHSNKKLIINAARGGVVEETALIHAIESGKVENVVLDVWEYEPLFMDTSAIKAMIATPHIAGYSLEAKKKATEMILDALYTFFNLSQPKTETETQIKIHIDPSLSSFEQVLQHIHPQHQYDKQLRALIGKTETQKKAGFHALRHTYRLRHEFSHILLNSFWFNRFPILNKLGLKQS